MKRLLTTSVLCIITTVNATNLGFNLLESNPESLQQQLKKAKESSSDEGKLVLVPSNTSNNKNKPSKKVVHAKTKKPQHKKVDKKIPKHGASSYNQSYNVNEVFSQQQEQANEIIAKTNQINSAAQKVAKDASVQAQKTQDLLKAQKEAQASANATISSANELNKLSMSLQKNVTSGSKVDGSDNSLLESESFNK